MAEHLFTLHAEWSGGRNSIGHLEAGGLKTDISIPQAMGGPGAGTNPDEMLLGAAATCYLITLAAMIERAELPLASMSLASEAHVDVTRGIFTYDRIVHRPRVRLQADATPKAHEKLQHLLLKAERACMISKAIRGNVTVSVEPA